MIFFMVMAMQGKPQYGPFDGIIITAAAPEIPAGTASAAKDGGRLVIPVGSSGRR